MPGANGSNQPSRPLKILLLLAGESHALALALLRQGHDVRVAVADASVFRHYLGIGFLAERAHFGGSACVDAAVAAFAGPPDLIVLNSLEARAQGLAARARELFPQAPFLGSPGPRFSALEQDRGAFKDACRAHGVLVPEARVERLSALREALPSLRYPLMLKPFDYRDAAGSAEKYLVIRARDAAEARLSLDAIEAAVEGRDPRILAEEFVEGFEISCGAFFDGGASAAPGCI